MKNHLTCIVLLIGILLTFVGYIAATAADVEPETLNDTSSVGGDPGKALYLTKYIESGNIRKAQQLASVHHPDISIPSYAGYFTVNKTFNSNLFFWYFPAAKNADKAPVVLWLQGGPGASSLFGLFIENGPYSINEKEKLVPRKYSWHLNHHLIYIDNPVGTGFSFTNSEKGYATNEIDVGQNVLNALQQFFRLFPNLQRNEFYLTGESYAGKYVPAIGHAIYKDSKRQKPDSTKPKINLKGLAIGNGFTDPIHQVNYADYLYQLGLIDLNQHEEFMKQQNQVIELMKNRKATAEKTMVRKYRCGLKFHGLLWLFENMTGYDNIYDFLQTKRENLLTMDSFLQKSEIRRAIHVGNNKWHGLNENVVIKHLLGDTCDSVADWVAKLLSYYRVLVYNGQLDVVVAYPLTENYLRNLNFSSAKKYKTAKRSIWRVDNEIAGYVKHAGNLTEVLIRNAGHMTARDQPKWTLDMLHRFTHHEQFP